MNLNTVFPLPAWLTADEKKRYNKMKRPLLAHARDLGIKMDPFLLAQINDYLIGQLLLARAEMKLQNIEEMPDNLIEKLFKHREKLGKMRQELSAAFEKAAEKTTKNTQVPAVVDPSDMSDSSAPSDLSDPSAPSDPSDLSNPPQAATSPKTPPITPNTVAAFIARQNAERDRLRKMIIQPQAKAVAV